ncbi:O-methyltransferase [Streptomyces sp. NBC_01716]|uniref:O-methyltransferase n=1 Tax=Streptomyces sp. NBC_01716 TaxID=2975917 RepID=UPI003FCC78ED
MVAAERIAAETGFTKSCLPEVGRLLRLAAASKPDGVVAESGTGSGVGTAWLHSGLAAGARLVTVERDEELARRASGVFADDERVSVMTGDWRLLGPVRWIFAGPERLARHLAALPKCPQETTLRALRRLAMHRTRRPGLIREDPPDRT